MNGDRGRGHKIRDGGICSDHLRGKGKGPTFLLRFFPIIPQKRRRLISTQPLLASPNQTMLFTVPLRLLYTNKLCSDWLELSVRVGGAKPRQAE